MIGLNMSRNPTAVLESRKVMFLVAITVVWVAAFWFTTQPRNDTLQRAHDIGGPQIDDDLRAQGVSEAEIQKRRREYEAEYNLLPYDR